MDIQPRTQRKVRPREAEQILTALEGGVVPGVGIQHLLVGRSREVEELIRILDRIKHGGSDLRIWVGDFGSGKSFMLRTIEQLALQNNFVSSTLDLTPSRRFYASDGKALALYQEIIKQLRTRGVGEGNALGSILEQWFLPWLYEEKIDLFSEDEPDSQAIRRVEEKILQTISGFRSGGLSYELGQCAVQYLRGMVYRETDRKMQAIRWLGGLIPTKTEAKRELGIGQIISDDNWSLMLPLLTELFRAVGFNGFIVNFDELVNLYKLPRSQTRDQNYELILNIYNLCKSGQLEGLFVNLGATRNTVFNERRGMAGYGALKGRFGIEQEELSHLTDTRATLQILKPLTPEEIFTLLEKLQEIMQVSQPSDRVFSADQIARYMQAQLNRPGADEFLTPRAVIKDYLQLLRLARQNPDTEIDRLLELRFGNLGQVTMDADNQDELGIEII